jgi:hypothetical protein
MARNVYHMGRRGGFLTTIAFRGGNSPSESTWCEGTRGPSTALGCRLTSLRMTVRRFRVSGLEAQVSSFRFDGLKQARSAAATQEQLSQIGCSRHTMPNPRLRPNRTRPGPPNDAQGRLLRRGLGWLTPCDAWPLTISRTGACAQHNPPRDCSKWFQRRQLFFMSREQV